MSQDQADYVTDALEMMGAGYASIEIEQAKTIIIRRAGKMVSEDRPAFVKVSTAFKQELSVISGDALKVWLFIALSINRNTGKANPGLRTIAASVKLAINTVQKVLKELEEMELLTVDRESNRYNIYETPQYISANKAEPTVSRDDTPAETVSNLFETVSNFGQSVSPSVILNQSNQNKPDNDSILEKYKAMKADPLQALLDMANFPGAKREARVNSILSYLGETFHKNVETKEWREFAKYVDGEHTAKGWDVKRFVEWLYGQKNFDLQYWPVKKMRENYPAAFAEIKSDIPQYKPLPEDNNHYVPNPNRQTG